MCRLSILSSLTDRKAEPCKPLWTTRAGQVKHWLPLLLALALSACSFPTTIAGPDHRLIPECGSRGCGVSYYLRTPGQQDLIEFGWEAGKFYARRVTYITHGNYALSQLCADPAAAWAQPGSAPC